MFLMAHGLSPGGEINMGKRLKPQAFFHNLLPSSSSPPLQWPAQQTLIQNQTHPVCKAHKSCDYSNIDRGADVSGGSGGDEKQTGDEEWRIL